MKKVVIIVILVLLLLSGLCVGAAYWFGVETEHRYHAILQQASQIQYLKFVNESYGRGFFTSKARTVVEVQLPPGTNGQTQPIRLTLVHDITHGPFPFGKLPEGKGQFKPLMAIIETGVVMNPETRSRLTELYAQIPELQSIRDYILLDLEGNGEEHFLIPAFRRTLGNEEKVVVDWKGLFFQLSFTSDLKKLTGSLSIPGLEIAGKDFEFKIKEIKSAFNSQQGLSGIALGEASFELAGLEVADKETGQPLFLRSFTAKASNKASGDNINYSLALRADELKLAEKQYGPGVFEMELRNLDPASIIKIQQAARELQSQNMQISSEDVQKKLLSKYAEILPDLLKKSPEIELTRFEVKTSDGDFAGKVKIAFDGAKSKSPLDLLVFINGVAAQAEFKAAESLVQRMVSNSMKAGILAESKIPEAKPLNDQEINAMASQRMEEQLKALMAQNLVVKEDGNYGIKASYGAGQVVLNGRTLALQDFMQ